MSAPSPYESRALEQIHAWKNPHVGLIHRGFHLVTKPIDLAGQLVMKFPGMGWIAARVLGGLLTLLNDSAAWTVRQRAILRRFQPAPSKPADLRSRDLEEIDIAIGWLAGKYKLLAASGGAVAGGSSNLGPIVGGAAIAADITSLIALNLRAVSEYATFYGFDITHPEEREFALRVLDLSTSTTDAGKAAAMASIVKLGKDVAVRKTWSQLEKHAFVQMVQRLASALAIRLTKAKLAQILPVAGALIGGGYNAYYTSRVCENARMLYRERFLAEKYGPDLIEAFAEQTPLLEEAG